VNELIKDVTQSQEKTYTWNSKQSGYVGAWSSGYNIHRLTEWIHYKRHEYNLMLESEDTERRKGILQEIILDLKQ